MIEPKDDEIYDPNFVRGVFDRCSGRYRTWSQIASFGFVWIWRRSCIVALPKATAVAPVAFDLMAGTGETWPRLLGRCPEIIRVTAVDISSEMNRRALALLHRGHQDRIVLMEADVLQGAIPPESADYVVSTFGLKTFNKLQQRQLAYTIASVLKSGGAFSLIEASNPRGWALHGLYRFYLKTILPLVEAWLLNGAQDFAMIGTYVENFDNCLYFACCLQEAGLDVQFKSYFFGCASGVSGRKP